MSSTRLAETEEDVFDLTQAVPETERLDSSLQKAKAQLSVKTRRHRPSRSRLRDSLSSTEGEDSYDGKSFSSPPHSTYSPLHPSLRCSSPFTDIQLSSSFSTSPAWRDRASTLDPSPETPERRGRYRHLLDSSSQETLAVTPPCFLFQPCSRSETSSPAHLHQRDHIQLHEKDRSLLRQGDHFQLHEKDHSVQRQGDHIQLHEKDHSVLHQGDHSVLHQGDHTQLHEKDHFVLRQGDQIQLHEKDRSVLHQGDHVQLHKKDHSVLRQGDHFQLHEKDHSVLCQGDHFQLHEKGHSVLHQGDHVKVRQGDHYVQLHEKDHSVLRQRDHSQSEDDSHDVGSDEPSSPTVLLDKKTRRRFLDLGVTLRRTYGKVRKERTNRLSAGSREPERAEGRSSRSSGPPFVPFSWFSDRIRGSSSPKSSSQSPTKSMSKGSCKDEEFDSSAGFLESCSRSSKPESSQPYRSLSEHSDEACDSTTGPDLCLLKKKSILPFSTSRDRTETEKQNGVHSKKDSRHTGDGQKLLTT